MAQLEIVVALSDNFVIGANGQIPWHLSEDLRHFKEITTSHPVLMGRRTFESIGRVLPNRQNIMVSRTFDKEVEGLTVVSSLEEALKAACGDRVMVIGGARMYAEALPSARVLHLTRVHTTVDGDTIFPDFTKYPFELKDRVSFHSEKCNFDYDFETWIRKE